MSDSVVNLAATAVRNYGKNTFKLKPFENIYTCNTGQIIPAFGTIQINPGSTWKITTSILARLNTSRYPTIARGWVEYMWVYVPHMQIWEHWDALQGENEESAWVSSAVYSVPQITIPQGSAVRNGDLLDYFGIVPGIDNTSISALLLRAYNWACDQIARDQNIEAPFAPDTSDSAITYVPGGSHTVGGLPYTINRKADYFSTCLPEPQKGPDVYLPLGTNAPVKNTLTSGGTLYTDQNGNNLSYMESDNSGIVHTYDNNAQTPTPTTLYGIKIADNQLFTDLSQATASNIMDVRNAIVTQHIYERDARSGTRAPEMLYARWGVEVDPLEMGRPRILDMGRFPIDFEQIAQTSQTTTGSGGSEQGTLTAFGYTNNRSEKQTFSFKYAGSLLCLVAIRFEHKYQYGLRQEFMKKDRFDFWHPEFAGLGDQPVYDAEIFATTSNISNKSIFGYNIRGAEYLNYPSMICGQVRSNYATSLDFVHMADEYASTPVLAPTWMKESPANVDRTIFVTSATAHQWLIDFVAEFEITDTLPAFAIPGIDRI